MTITIYHNPKCGTSRNTLQMLHDAGHDPVIIEYLKNPPSKAELLSIIKQTGQPVRALIRDKGDLYNELDIANEHWNDDQLVDFMVEHPVLINRPIVVTPKGAALCRPKEKVLELL